MLHWFARRLNELHKEDRKGEKGFTLIELLVVVIIIGILAAIAIPTFLAQRDRANNATAQSDLRNAATAAQSCAAANGGSYTAPNNCGTTATLDTYGYSASDGVTLTPTATATRWQATSVHEGGDTTYSFDSDTGQITP